jgi:tRNA(His) 5'-end guanylyltransferase
MKNDEFGDRMKAYERVGTDTRADPTLPLCVRIDGKTFSKFTKQFEKPFDVRMTNAMANTCKRLVEATNANIGYVQSDEITLIFTCEGNQSEHMFGGKFSKINSILASMATAFFNDEIRPHTDKLAFFDCRSWVVPSLVEASNTLLWRVQDCRKNSISACFRWTKGGGAKEMMHKDQTQMRQYLRGVCGFDCATDLTDQLKYGSMFKRVVVDKELDLDVYMAIPEKSRPASRMVKRTEVQLQDIGYYGDMDKSARVVFIVKSTEKE